MCALHHARTTFGPEDPSSVCWFVQVNVVQTSSDGWKTMTMRTQDADDVGGHSWPQGPGNPVEAVWCLWPGLTWAARTSSPWQDQSGGTRGRGSLVFSMALALPR